MIGKRSGPESKGNIVPSVDSEQKQRRPQVGDRVKCVVGECFIGGEKTPGREVFGKVLMINPNIARVHLDDGYEIRVSPGDLEIVDQPE